MVTVGTRPEAVKLAPVVLEMQASADIEPILVSTGQHGSALDEVLTFFGLEPEYELDVLRPGQSLISLVSRCMASFEALLERVDPDITMVQGDTSSALAAAVVGFSTHVPVWHVEAGLRTGTPDLPFPEEMNRRLIDCMASIHLAPTPRARDNLLGEGVSSEQIEVTGNTGIDALFLARALNPELRDATLAAFLRRGGPVLVVTTHRRESWDTGVTNVARAINRLITSRPDLRAVYVTHPNPALRRAVRREVGSNERILVVEPLGYADFVQLLSQADLVITDSGGVQEEAPYLGVPVLVTRTETERAEGVTAGLAQVVGLDPDRDRRRGDRGAEQHRPPVDARRDVHLRRRSRVSSHRGPPAPRG